MKRGRKSFGSSREFAVLFWVVMFLCLCWHAVAKGDVILLEGTRMDAFVRMIWITALTPTTAQGEGAACRLGQTTSSDTSIVLFALSTDTIVDHGVDSSEVDSIVVTITNTVSTVLSASFGHGDSVWCAFYKVVAADTGLDEATTTFVEARNGVNWDTLSLGHGNDIVTEGSKSGAFGTSNVWDTAIVFVGGEFLFVDDFMKTQKGDVWDNIEEGSAEFEFYLPLQDVKESVASGAPGNDAVWAIKPYRIHIEGGDSQAGLTFHGDDGVGANQMEVRIYYTSSAVPTNGRRRRIIQGIGQMGSGIERTVAQ